MTDVFVTPVGYLNDTFYSKDNTILLFQYPVRSGSPIETRTLDTKADSKLLPFAISECYLSGQHVGFVIEPTIQFRLFGTGVILYYNSWAHSPKPLRSDEIFVALKLPSLYVFSAINKATVITTPNLSDSLNDYLTML